MAKLVQHGYGVPRPVVLAGVSMVALAYFYMAVAVVAAIVDALAPWGPWGWPQEHLLEYSFLCFIVLPFAGSYIVARLVYRGMRLGLLRGQLVDQGATVRLRTCPSCGYDQAGTPGAVCPECGCPVAFARDDLAEGADGQKLATGPRSGWAPWQVVRAVLLPGAAAGLAGLLAFGSVHAALIAPIWGRLAGGWPFALLGGIAVAWAFHELFRASALSGRYREALRFGALLWLGLVPMNAFGLLVRIVGASNALGTWEIVFEVALAVGSGAAMGWLLTRRRRAAAALGAATLALGLATGGPTPLTTINGPALFAWMLLICIVAALPVIATRRACGCGRSTIA